MSEPIDDIIAPLGSIAAINRERAYSVLGARPGPGVDIVIKPTNPVSGKYDLEGKTQAGKAYLEFFPPSQIDAGWRLRRFKEELTDFGLTFETDWSNVVDVKVDP